MTTDDSPAQEAPLREPVAWLHTVRVLSEHAEPGEMDQALSFSADSFPLGDAGLFESIDARPLWLDAADALSLDEIQEYAALLIDLDNIEDPQRVPFPAIEDRDWRAHAGRCSRMLRRLARRITGASS